MLKKISLMLVSVSAVVFASLTFFIIWGVLNSTETALKIIFSLAIIFFLGLVGLVVDKTNKNGI